MSNFRYETSQTLPMSLTDEERAALGHVARGTWTALVKILARLARAVSGRPERPGARAA